MKPLRALIALALLAAPSLAQDAYIIGPAGPYTVQTPGVTKVEHGDGWVRISWAADPAPNPGPTPGPTPEPPPNPTPPPAPVATGKLFVSLVFDADNETQDQATTRADLAVSEAWAGVNATFRAYAKTQKAVDELNLRGSLAELPCLIVQELNDGKAPIIKVVPAVDSAEAAIKAVKELRGAK